MNFRHLLTKRQKYFFSEFKKKKYDYNFFEYQPFKFKEERQLIYGQHNPEELFGVSYLGYESSNFRSEHRKLNINVIILMMMMAAYGWSFRAEAETFKKEHQNFFDKQIKAAKYY